MCIVFELCLSSVWVVFEVRSSCVVVVFKFCSGWVLSCV